MNRLGYKLVFEADKCIIFKNNLFVGRAYLCNSLLKLSLNLNKDVVCNVSLDSSNEKVDLHYLWHLRSGRVNFDKIALCLNKNLFLCAQN